MSTIETLEVKLGNTLWVLRDKLDLAIRQGDAAVIDALKDLDEVWEVLALLVSTEKKAKTQQLYFNAVQDGNSVIDALFHYACEMHPNSTVAKKLGY